MYRCNKVQKMKLAIYRNKKFLKIIKQVFKTKKYAFLL